MIYLCPPNTLRSVQRARRRIRAEDFERLIVQPLTLDDIQLPDLRATIAAAEATAVKGLRPDPLWGLTAAPPPLRSRPGRGGRWVDESAVSGGRDTIGCVSVATGHVYLRRGKRGDVWYAKFRLVDGRQLKKRLGLNWTERRPPSGFITRRLAEARLRELLAEAQRGGLTAQQRVGVTFGEACEEWLRYVEHDRGRARSTVADYRSVVSHALLPEFGADTALAAGQRRADRLISSAGRGGATALEPDYQQALGLAQRHLPPRPSRVGDRHQPGRRLWSASRFAGPATSKC